MDTYRTAEDHKHLRGKILQSKHLFDLVLWRVVQRAL